MKIHNTARVDADADAVFALLGDPERVVGCLPGAALTGRDGEAWAGGVTVKVGPVTVAYTGTVRFDEVDPTSRSMRLIARGRDSRGSGDAEADVWLRAQADGAGTVLDIDTDLLIRGKLAQFGKGAIATVSDKILQQFAGNLGELAAREPAADERSAEPAGAGPRVAPPTAVAPAPASPVTASSAGELDGWALLVRPMLQAYGPRVALVSAALVQGYLMGRAVTIERFYRSHPISSRKT